jgi:glycosyltransferase involved in cell wall biosynthesis
VTAVAFTGRMRHFIDHLAPVWREVGGDFWVPLKLKEHAHRLGVPAVGYDGDAPPIPTDILTVCAARGDYFRLKGPVVYMAHGNGQGFATGEHNGYAGGTGLDRVVRFLSPNEHNAAAWRRSYPNVPVDVVGCPKLDDLPPRRFRERGSRPVVAISFHWDTKQAGNKVRETWSAWRHYRRAVEGLVRSKRPYDLIVHGHPRMQNGLARWSRKLGVEWVPDFRDVLARADLYVNDCSSTLYEAATVMPVVVLNIPEYRREVEHGLRFWEFADVGLQVEKPAELGDAIWRALTDPPEIRERREAIVAEVYPHRGEAAKRAAEAIRQSAGVNAVPA